jgi:hypothetical protein
MRARTLAQFFVMDQRRLSPERHGPTATKGPFTTIAIGGPDIAVDVESSSVM